MTGKGRFLVFGIVAILVASSALFWTFSMYDAETGALDLVPDDELEGGAGASEQDSNYSPLDGVTDTTTDGSRLDIGSNELPWEGGLVAFVLLSSTVMIVLFARLREEDVLEGVRKEMYQYISDNPGEHLAEITRQFGMSSSSARHHLDVLEWSDRIVSHKSG
ncbi:MAG: hypothetical protein KAJ33_01790, partial [Thermoplasmata archaeon]|nr:hypothetical protein [Thermoplasmata archaeon]